MQSATDLLPNDTAEKDRLKGLQRQQTADLKAHGFASTGAVFMNLEEGGALGVHLQAGYLLGGKWQPAVRVVYIDSADDIHQEVGVAFSAYLHKHKFKWQSDVSALLGSEDGDDTDLIARSQLQLAF